MNQSDEEYQKEKFEWYQKDKRRSEIFSYIPFIVGFLLPMFFFIKSTFDFEKQQALDKKNAEIFKNEYLVNDSKVASQIVLLGARPSAYKRSQK